MRDVRRGPCGRGAPANHPVPEGLPALRLDRLRDETATAPRPAVAVSGPALRAGGGQRRTGCDGAGSAPGMGRRRVFPPADLHRARL